MYKVKIALMKDNNYDIAPKYYSIIQHNLILITKYNKKANRIINCVTLRKIHEGIVTTNKPHIIITKII